jgi:ATP-dependent Lhr-like helicase
VILVNGTLAAYLSRGARQLLAFLPEEEPQKSAIGRPLAQQLATMARAAGLLIAEINGIPTPDHPLAAFLEEAGFRPSAMGFLLPRAAAPTAPAEPSGAGEPYGSRGAR